MPAPHLNDQPTALWKLRRENREIDCLVRLMPYGIEVDIAHDGVVVLTRVFETDDEALEWAGRKRATREAEGWSIVSSNRPGPRAN
jgi:hypothetical protein